MRCLALALLLGVLAAPAWAGGYSGYHYPPGLGGTTVCTPDCTGVQATYIEPTPVYAGTNGEAQETSFIWVGISGSSGHGDCTVPGNNPLIQMGTEPFILSNLSISHVLWREEFGCNAVTQVGGLTVNSGDTMNIKIECTANCTSGATGQSWTYTWTNVTTGLSVNNVRTGFKVYMEHVDITVEPTSAGTDSAASQPLQFNTPIKFFGAQIKQGGVWIPIPLTPDSPTSVAQQAWQKIKNTPSTMSLYNASVPLVDPSGVVSFYVCSSIVQTTGTLAPPCPAAVVSGTAGFGP